MRSILNRKQRESADKDSSGICIFTPAEDALLLLSGFFFSVDLFIVMAFEVSSRESRRSIVRSVCAAANAPAFRECRCFAGPAHGTIGARAYWLPDTITFGEEP